MVDSGSSPPSRQRSEKLSTAAAQFGNRIDRVSRYAQCLADFANGTFGSIGRYGRGHARTIATVLFVQILQHLFAPLMLEVDVDVGSLVSFAADKTLEQQIRLAGVNVGDAKAITDR